MMNQWQFFSQYNSYHWATPPNGYYENNWVANHQHYYNSNSITYNTPTGFLRPDFPNYFPAYVVERTLHITYTNTPNKTMPRKNRPRNPERASKTEPTPNPNEAITKMEIEVVSIFKELNSENIQLKGKQIQSMITDENAPWLSKFLISNLNNFDSPFFGYSSLFPEFFDYLQGNKEFKSKMISEIVASIHEILEDKTKRNEIYRAKLRSLGHLLGIFTLKQNRPILSIEVDIKVLLKTAINRRDHEELDFLFPFVAKIMESSIYTKIFAPRKNPWTRSILTILTNNYVHARLSEYSALNIKLLFKMVEEEELANDKKRS